MSAPSSIPVYDVNNVPESAIADLASGVANPFCISVNGTILLVPNKDQQRLLCPYCIFRRGQFQTKGYQMTTFYSHVKDCSKDTSTVPIHQANWSFINDPLGLIRAGKAQPNRPSLHIQIGEALIALREWKEAEQAFRRALTIDPHDPHALLGVARACLRQRRVTEGVEAALESIGSLYQNAMAHYILGLGLLRMKQYERAVKAVQVAVYLNPNFERAHRFLARYARRIDRDMEKSLKHWAAVRHIRSQRLLQGHDGNTTKEAGSLEGLVPEFDQKGARISYDAAPSHLADKNGVPDDPAECITVVAGLPRSGTSMMMQMLEAAPLPILTDNKRSADTDNPRGYFELEDATRLRQEKDWLQSAKGHAVKIVAQLLPFVAPDHSYRVIFMDRELHEVLRSQQVMLQRLGRTPSQLSNEQLEAAFSKQLKQVRMWLAKQPNIKTLFVSHREAIEHPVAVAKQVNRFLGGGLDIDAMAGVVEASLYRQRAGK